MPGDRLKVGNAGKEIEIEAGVANAAAAADREIQLHIITQLQPCAGGAYGSSPFPTGPHTEGTR